MHPRTEEIIVAFEAIGRKVIRRGGDVLISCPGPAHRRGDLNPSLSVSDGEKGPVLHCFAGDETTELLSLIGMSERDLFYERSGNGTRPTTVKRKAKPKNPAPNGTTWRMVAEYEYLDEEGKFRYLIKREELFDAHGKPVLDERGKREKRFDSTGVTKEKRIPYHLDMVAGARQTGDRVFLVEGEKCSDFIIQKLGAIATTLGSVDAFDAELHRHYFAGIRQLIVIPDESEKSQKSFVAAASALADVARDVRFVVLPGLEPEQDIVDFFEGRDFDEQAAELERLIERASPIRPKFELLDSLIEEPDTDPVWLVNELIPAGEEIVLVYGRERQGKSLALLEVCFALATGTDAFAMERFAVPRPVNVLYVCEEDPRAPFKRRARALGLGRGTPKAGPRLRVSIRKGWHFDRKKDQDEIIELALRYESEFIGLDPLSRLTQLVGGSGKDFLPFADFLMRLSRETGATLALVAHDKHRLLEDGTPHRDAIAGGGILPVCTAPIHFVSLKDGERQLVPTDYKFHEAPAPFAYRLETPNGVDPLDAGFYMRLVGQTKSEDQARVEAVDQEILFSVAVSAAIYVVATRALRAPP